MKVFGKANLICVGIAVYIAMCVAFLQTPENFFAGLLMAIAGVAVIAFYIYKFFKSFEPTEEQKAKHERMKKQQKEREERLKPHMPGNWIFPVEDFSKKCTESGFVDLNNDIHLRKMVLIAVDMAKNKGCPDNEIAKYTTAKMIKTYIKLAKDEHKAQKATETAEKKIERMTPHNSTLGKEDIEFVEFNRVVKNYVGFEKRKAYIEFDIYRKKLMLAIAKKDYKTAKSITANATYKPDWAIMGGIANAIGGPAAGVAVAQKTMADNVETEFDKIYKRMAFSNEFEKRDAVEKIKKEIKTEEKEMDELNLKIHFDEISSEELYKSLTITPKALSTMPWKFNFEIKNDYEAKKELTTVIDGTFQVKIYCDEIFVEEICVALPKFGVECGKTAKVSMFTYKYMTGKNRNYRFEISPNKFYLLER